VHQEILAELAAPVPEPLRHHQEGSAKSLQASQRFRAVSCILAQIEFTMRFISIRTIKRLIGRVRLCSKGGLRVTIRMESKSAGRALGIQLLLPFCLLFSGVQAQQGGQATLPQPEKKSQNLGIGSQYLPPPAMPPQLQAGPNERIQSDFQETPSLTLQAALDLAQQYNPTLRQSRAQVNAALGTAIQAGLYPNPELAYSAEQIGVGGTPGEFHGATFRQEIVTAGKLRLSREKYLQRVAVAEALAVAQQYRVCNDIKIHFYDALAQAQLVEVHHELAKSAEDAAFTVRELYNVGQASRSDVLQTNVKLQRTRLDLQATENRFQQTFRQLTSIIGVPLPLGPIENPPEETPQVADFDLLLTQLWENSPLLIAARAKLRSDQITIERERVQPIPNLQFEGGAGYNFEAEETVALAGVAVRLPIWDRNQGTLQQARADAARQQAEVQRLQLLLRRDLADYYQEYVTSAQHVRQFQEVILPDAREAYRTLLQSYKENRAEWSDVLGAQRDYFETRIDYISELARWRKSDVLIRGMLLHGGLMAAASPTPPGHIDATPRPR
jgi:outer membrane protein, heavy metal efflux system